MLIPKEVKNVMDSLKRAGYEAYIVGGCARDFLLEKEPNDWDVTTNAKPEELTKVFPDSFDENKFLTVTVRTGSKNEKLAEIEITTYRHEAEYSDKRHPDSIQYADSLEEDLKRRDFTINAIALGPKFQIPKSKSQINPKPKILNSKLILIDLFGGEKDLKDKIIRAVRFATTLDFSIEEKTADAIKKNSIWLEAISKERIRDEFVKIIMADNAANRVELLRELNLLKY